MREFLVRTWVGFARKSLGPLLQAVGHWIRDGTWNPFTSLFNRHVVCSSGLLHLVRQPCSWCPSQILWWQGTQRPSLWSDMIRLLWAMIRVWCECFFFPEVLSRLMRDASDVFFNLVAYSGTWCWMCVWWFRQMKHFQPDFFFPGVCSGMSTSKPRRSTFSLISWNSSLPSQIGNISVLYMLWTGLPITSRITDSTL